MSELAVGPELDKEVGRVVFGLDDGIWYDRYSTDIAAAWVVVAQLEPLVCTFKAADGFIWIGRGDFASHDVGGECHLDKEPDDRDDDLPDDPEPYSAHIHLGLLGADVAYPTGWDHGQRYCSRGATAPEAICRAALRALAP